MPFKLPVEIYSPQLLESVTYEIEQYVQWRREANVQKRVGAAVQKPEPHYSEEASVLITTWAGEAEKPTLEMLEKLLSYLKTVQVPLVHITLAALPDNSQRQKIVQWLHRNIGSALLVSFTVDRTIAGGVIIRTPNRLFDCSWKDQLLSNATKMGEVLQHVG